MSSVGIVIMAVVFVLLMTVIYRTVESGFGFGKAGNIVISICVSLLAALGISRLLSGSIEFILLPYVALGITILLALIIGLFGKKNGQDVRQYREDKLDKSGENISEKYDGKLRR